MRVADVETHIVANPPPGRGGRWFLFVTVTTDDGIRGVGEVYASAVGARTQAAVVADVADRHLVGHSPFDTVAFLRRAYGSGFSSRPDPTILGAASALEMACWDIAGKATGQPVWKLLGGRVHDALRTYTYLYPPTGDLADAAAVGDDAADVYTDPDAAAEVAAAEVARGHTGVKFDPGGPYTIFGGHQPTHARVDGMARFVGTIREAVGTGADLLVGTHGQFSPGGASRVARALERHDPLWFEEPIPPDDPAGMARVAAATSIPIAAGERLCMPGEFVPVLASGAVSIVQPNAGRVGGIGALRDVGVLAAAHGATVAPHCYCGPVVAAANVAVATTMPNFTILEAIGDFGGFHADVLETPIRWEAGFVVPSEEPGLGVALDMAVVRAHEADPEDLHLEAWGDPIDVADPPGARGSMRTR